MYLAMEKGRQGQRFYLRRSILDDSGTWIYEDLFDLGRDPEEFIEYIDERIFLVSQEIQDALFEKEVEYEYEELEEIFWPFVDPAIKQTIMDFGGLRGRNFRRRKRYSKNELRSLQKNIHPFDRKRALFLKFLQVNLAPLFDEPFPFLNDLLGKSRDEIENYFLFLEMDLRPWEMRSYLYAIFGIGDRFAPRLTRFVPEAQSQTEIDRFFLEELCRLNADDSFLDKGATPFSQGIHPYLRRYLIQFFDFSFATPGSASHEYTRKGGSSLSSQAKLIGFEESLEILGVSEHEYLKMTEKDLISHFRKKAQNLHPDKGGDHEAFLKLKEAFEELLTRMKG